MRTRYLHAFAALAAASLVSSVVAVAQDRATLLADDFRTLDVGLFSPGVTGAITEYHYLASHAPKGNWVVSMFRTDGSQRAWRVVADGGDAHGERFMQQAYLAASPERTYMHPMVVAGDELFSDYELETRFSPDGGAEEDGLAGIVFRYRNDRRYYFAGVAGQRAVLTKVDHGPAYRKLNETILAEQPLAWKPGAFIPVKVTVAGERLRAAIGPATLEASDATFAAGKIGFTSDFPTRFGGVRVTCTNDVKAAFDAAVAKRQADEDARVRSSPKMVLWRRFDTRGFGVSRNLRFGDLDGDGVIDLLIPQQKRHGPSDSHSEVGCLTAMTFDGKRLWQNGSSDAWNTVLSNDVAVQIHDLDGDGKTEVVYCRDFELIVADGATGKRKLAIPTPDNPRELDPLKRPRRFEQILGDSLAFADLRGTGHPRDILLKDRYRNLWAYNDRLELLWTVKLNTGHYPFPHDVDGDGRDEVAVGYSLVSPEGKIIWSNDKLLEDHADGVAIVKLKDDGEKRVLTAASDEGFVLLDTNGKIVKHHQIGHAQTVSVGNFRPDLPGLEMATSNFWGNQGILNFFDAGGNLYHDAEPAQHGSPMLPVNWTGDGAEFWLLSANPTHGGLFDGWCHRSVRFPADGHPDLCAAVLDLTGDARDEIVVWDPWEVWVYTQSDSPKPGKLYKPKRNPLWNESNYRASVSLPGWSE